MVFLKQKLNSFFGLIGAGLGIFVFIAYVPQIIENIGGDKCHPLQPLIAALSCLVWVLYGWTKEPKKDWALIIPNALGVVMGLLTFATCF